MDNQGKVYVLGDKDCDYVAVSEMRKKMNQTMQAATKWALNLDPISAALLRCSWNEGAKGLIIVRPDESEHYVNFGSTVIKSMSKVMPTTPEAVDEVLLVGNFSFRTTYINTIYPKIHAVKSKGDWGSWQYFVLTFDIMTTTERGSLSSAWHSNVGLFFDGQLSEAFDWFNSFRVTAENCYPVIFNTGIQFCSLCGIELTADDFEDIVSNFHCVACVTAREERHRRQNARKVALAKFQHRADAVASGVRKLVKCTLCGTKFDRMTILVDDSSAPFCSKQCATFYNSYHSEDRRIYTPQLLRSCLAWRGKNCAIPGCDNNQPKAKNSWNVCSEHYIRITNALKKQNDDRLAILQQFDAAA